MDMETQLMLYCIYLVIIGYVLGHHYGEKSAYKKFHRKRKHY